VHKSFQQNRSISGPEDLPTVQTVQVQYTRTADCSEGTKYSTVFKNGWLDFLRGDLNAPFAVKFTSRLQSTVLCLEAVVLALYSTGMQP
jgi:hypothetical protein